MNVAVVGAGSWGAAFAGVMEGRGHEVTLAGRDASERPEVATADLVCVAVPSRAFREVTASLRGSAPVIILTKGLDPETGKRLSQVVEGREALALSGPNHAEEIAQGLPAAAVLASTNEELATELQHEIHSVRFRLYVNTDLVGVELCAAAKNVIALAAGAVDGLEAGDNGKAALITRGLAELTRLACAAGGRRETLAGLSGLGDLVLTCTGNLSRNRHVGLELARGRALTDILASMKMVAEGVRTTGAALELGTKYGVELPIATQMSEVLSGRSDVRTAISALMLRKQRAESETSTAG